MSHISRSCCFVAQTLPAINNPRTAALTESVGDMPERARVCGMEVQTQADVAPVAKQLAGLALERAVAFAERYTSVDDLLEAHRDNQSGQPAVRPAKYDRNHRDGPDLQSEQRDQ